MQLTCIRAFGGFSPGDTAEVPDGASYSPLFWVAGGAESPAAVPDVQAPALAPQNPATAGPASPAPVPVTSEGNA